MKTRGFQEPESLTWLNFCSSRTITLTKNCPTTLMTHNISPFKSNNYNKESSDNFELIETLVDLIIKSISVIEIFFLSIIIFKILAEISELTPVI